MVLLRWPEGLRADRSNKDLPLRTSTPNGVKGKHAAWKSTPNGVKEKHAAGMLSSITLFPLLPSVGRLWSLQTQEQLHQAVRPLNRST